METAEMILTQPVLSPEPLKKTQKSTGISEERKKQVARNFESILTCKIISQMENTIGNWGFEKEGVSKQIQGLFSFSLCDHIAKNGGLGLWKVIYDSSLSSAQ